VPGVSGVADIHGHAADGVRPGLCRLAAALDVMIGSQPSKRTVMLLGRSIAHVLSGEQICAPADYSLCLRSG
jgi:hypothetical protein